MEARCSEDRGKCIHIELRTKLIVVVNGMFTLRATGSTICPVIDCLPLCSLDTQMRDNALTCHTLS